MTIQTIGDAIAISKLQYRGREEHLLAKLDWWAQQLGPDRPFTSITADDIDQGIGVLMTAPAMGYKRNVGVVSIGRPRTSGTINKYLAALGTMYKILRLNRHVPRSFQAPSMKGLRLPEEPGRTLQVTIADVKRLVDAARLSRNRKLSALIAVACTTGLRRSSIQALTWGDVDLKARTIDVARTKNGAPTRSVLPQWAATELSRIKPDQPEKHWLVFDQRQFKRAWAMTLERADIPGSENWTFHHTRHIAASILAQSGASLPVIMQALNHKTVSMAIRYSHVNTKALDQAVSNAWG